MKTFAGVKPLKQVLAQCKALGLIVDDDNYRNGGWDSIYIVGGRGWVRFNTFNGNFSGMVRLGLPPCMPPTLVPFSSQESKHDKEPWMQNLLSFFYKEKA